jgi:hypothetical protein
LLQFGNVTDEIIAKYMMHMILRHVAFHRVARRCLGSDPALWWRFRPAAPVSDTRDPHQMQMDFEYSVRAPPLFRHPRSLSGAHALKAVA